MASVRGWEVWLGVCIPARDLEQLKGILIESYRNHWNFKVRRAPTPSISKTVSPKEADSNCILRFSTESRGCVDIIIITVVVVLVVAIVTVICTRVLCSRVRLARALA